MNSAKRFSSEAVRAEQVRAKPQTQVTSMSGHRGIPGSLHYMLTIT